MADTRALWASGLGVRHGRRWVFRDLTLSLPPGEVLRLSGPIGSGKSTLLRVLAGVSRPSAGVVRHRPPVVSYVPTLLRAPWGVSTGQYLRHLGKIRGLVPDEVERRSKELLDELGLSPTTVISEANHDVKCRVAVAQALLERPSLLIIDDPWSNMAAPSQADTIEVMTKRAERGCIVVFTAAPNWKPALQFTRHLTLSGGILHPAPPLPPAADGPGSAGGSAGAPVSSQPTPVPPVQMVRVVLYGNGVPLEPDTDGIVSITPYADGISILVRADHSAEVQDLALTHNWLIRRVENAP